MITSNTGVVKLSRNEGLKEAHPLLGGTIAQTLRDPSLERFSEDDYEFLKFHGIYQQDDRDKRKIAKQFIFMVRGRLPGGVVPPLQYLAFDRLASDFVNSFLKRISGYYRVRASEQRKVPGIVPKHVP